MHYLQVSCVRVCVCFWSSAQLLHNECVTTRLTVLCKWLTCRRRENRVIVSCVQVWGGEWKREETEETRKVACRPPAVSGHRVRPRRGQEETSRHEVQRIKLSSVWLLIAYNRLTQYSHCSWKNVVSSHLSSKKKMILFQLLCCFLCVL